MEKSTFKFLIVEFFMKVIRVNKTEFELDNGLSYPIDPPLDYEPTVEEFQIHYKRACQLAQSLKAAGGDLQNFEDVG